MRLLTCGILAAAALFVSLGAAPSARGQTPVVVKFPGGPDVFPTRPGQFSTLINSHVQWSVVLDNPGPGEIVFNYLDIMDPTGARSCDAAACPGADQLELLCDPPYEPNPDGGSVFECEPSLGRLDIRNVRVPAGQRSCVQFWTLVLPGARVTGGVQNVGCVDITAPLPAYTLTRPTTDLLPACDPMPGSGNTTGCSILTVPNIEPPSFTAHKTAAVEDVNLNGVNDVGDIITWTVDVTNTGLEAHDGYLYDPIPPGTTFLDILDNPDAACEFRAPDIDCTVLTFAPSETKTLRFRTTVDCSVVTNDDSLDACNTAYVCTDAAHATCGPSDDDTTAPPRPTCVTIPLPNLHASTKAWYLRDDNDGDGAVSTGDRIAFPLIVTNDGRGPATNVVLTDLIDVACIDEMTIDAGAGGYDNFTNILTWTIPLVAPGGFEQNEISALVVETGAACCNQASMTYPELTACSVASVPTDDPATPADDDTTCIVFGPQPIVLVEKDFVLSDDVDGDGVPDPGDELTFTITVRNDGLGAATDLVIDDLLIPCWADFVAASVIITGEGTNESTELTPPMTPNRVRVTGVGGADGLDPSGAEIVTITFAVRFQPGPSGACCNVANATYAESAVAVQSDDPTTGFQGDQTCSSRAASSSQLELVKTFTEFIPDGCLQPGEDVTFQIAVTARTTQADLIQLRDDITDAGAVFEVVNANGGTVEPGGDAITWDFGSVGPDETRLQTWIGRFACTTKTGDEISDVASAVAINAPSATSAPVTTTVSAPDLDLSQVFSSVDADASGTLNAGDTATITLTLENQGGCAAPQVILTLRMDADLDLTTLAADGTPDRTGDVLTWNETTTPPLASLGPGASVTYVVSALVLDPPANPDPAADGILSYAPVAVATTPFPICPIETRAPQVTEVVAVSLARLDSALRLTDADTDGCWESGERLFFEVEVTPVGGAGDDVVATLTFLDATDLLTVSDADGGTVAGNPETITWTLGDLPADTPATKTVEVLMRCDAPSGGLFGARLEVTSTNLPDPAAIVLDNLVTTAPLLEVTKSFTWQDDGDAAVEPGELVKYFISVRNAGTCQTRSITVLDLIDADLDRSTLVITPIGDDDGNGGLTWTGLGLDPGNSIELTIETTVLDPLTNPDVDANGLIDNQVTALVGSSFGCPEMAFAADAPRIDIGTTFGTYTMLRNDFITCLADARTTMGTFLRPRPVPQECSEPSAIDPAHRGTQVVPDAVSPMLFAGDANPASSFGQCPQTLVGFGRILVFYELDDPTPICVRTLRVRKSGGDVEVTW